VTKEKVQITKMEVNVVYLQAILPAVEVHVTGLESNVFKVGGQVEWSEKSLQELQCRGLQYSQLLHGLLQGQKKTCYNVSNCVKNCKIHLALCLVYTS
jgi:hypothetical protein